MGERIFVAVVPPADVIEHLDAFLEPRREHGPFRWTAAEQYHVTQEKAFDHVQARRFCISPNQNFQHQLEAYQYIQQAALSIAGDRAAGARPAEVRRKRADDSEDEAELERCVASVLRRR